MYRYIYNVTFDVKNTCWTSCSDFSMQNILVYIFYRCENTNWIIFNFETSFGQIRNERGEDKKKNRKEEKGKER